MAGRGRSGIRIGKSQEEEGRQVEKVVWKNSRIKVIMDKVKFREADELRICVTHTGRVVGKEA